MDENELYEAEIASIKKRRLSTSEKARMINEVRTLQDTVKPARPTRLFCDDTTMEALATVMAENGERGAMFSPEGGVLDSFERYTNKPNFDLVLKGHSGDPVRINRRGREETINRPALTIFCCSQPRVIEEIMQNKSYRERGLWARYLYVYPETKLGTRRYETKPISPEVKRAYRKLIFNLLDIPLPEKPDVEATEEPLPSPTPEVTQSMTMGQINVLKKAKSYLSYSAFSYKGLVKQLEYEQFSHEDAIFAADNCGADWSEQALKKAKSYLDYSAFSNKGLKKQLEYEGFTSEQSTYGVIKCGAD